MTWGGEEPSWGGAGRKRHCFRRSHTQTSGSHVPSASPVGHFSCPCPPHWILTPPSPPWSPHLRRFPVHSIPSCPPHLLSQLDALVPASQGLHQTRVSADGLGAPIPLVSSCCQMIPGPATPTEDKLHAGRTICFAPNCNSNVQLSISAPVILTEQRSCPGNK